MTSLGLLGASIAGINGSMKSHAQENLIATPREERDIWDQFQHDDELIERLKITPKELDSLANCALLGTLTCKQDLLFILRLIRDATSPEDAQAIALTPAAAYQDTIEEPPLDIGRIRLRVAPTAPILSEPGSLEGIVRRRFPEQLGISFWTLVLVAGLVWNFAIAMYRWHETFLSKIGAPAYKSPQSAPWYPNIDDFNMLIGAEILVVVCVAAVLYLRSRKRHRRFKVKPI
jgi:hypothetical protein